MPAIQEVFQPLELHLGSSRTRTEQLEIHLNTAADSLSSNDLDLAKEALEEARRWNPASTRIWLLWRDVYQAEDDLDGQQYALETAIGLSTNLGNILKWLEDLETLTGQKYHYCEICRQLGTMDGFCQVKNGYVTCPLCMGKSNRRYAKEWTWFFGVSILTLSLAGPITMLGGGWPLTFLATNGLLSILFILGTIPLHELSHALVARVLKGHVQGIQIGVGPKIFATSLRNIVVSINRYFIGGLTYTGFPTRRLIRLRTFLVILAGPLFHIALIAIFFSGAQWGTLVIGVAWRETFIIANGLLLLININPLSRANGVMGVPVDGAQLVQFMRGQQSADLIHQAYYIMRSDAVMQARDRLKALSTIDHGLLHYPQSRPFQLLRTIFLGDLGRYDEAIASLRVIQESQENQGDAEIDPGIKLAMDFYLLNVRNAMAYYQVLPFTLDHDPERSTECAMENFRKIPWMEGVRGTLGSCLVVLGFPAAGLMYLELANRTQASQDNSPHADNLAWSALAMDRLGRHDQALTILEHAREKSVENNLLSWIEGEMSDIDR